MFVFWLICHCAMTDVFLGFDFVMTVNFLDL